MAELLCNSKHMLLELRNISTVSTSSSTIHQTTEPVVVAELIPSGPVVKAADGNRRRMLGLARSVSGLLALVGISGTCITTFQPGDTYVEHTIVARLPLAMVWFLARSNIKARIQMRVSPNSPLRLTGTFSIARVVSRRHPFILACQQNDVAQFEVMLRSGMGRVTDIDDRGWSPLAVSIWNIVRASSANSSVRYRFWQPGYRIEALGSRC